MNDIIDLQLNYPVLEGQEKQLKSAMTQALSEIHEILPICEPGGNPADREVGAKWLSQPGYTVSSQNLFIGTGGHNALINAILSASLTNKAIATDELTYSNVKSIAKLFGLRLIPCPMDADGMDPSALAVACETAGVAAVYLMPTVHNPLGTVMPLRRREEIIAVARDKDLVIIEDDAYGFLEDAIIPNFFHVAPERSFYIYSFSKPLARAIKTSYLLAPDRYSEKVTESFRLTGSTPATLSIITLNKLIASGAVSALIAAKRQEGNFRQQQARLLLSDYDITGHRNGWHFWISLPSAKQSADVSNALLKRGVLVVPSSSFAVHETAHRPGIRVAMGNEIDFDRVVKGIMMLKEAL
ncbi:aminotransferase-like domain-containing protein [Dinghuibacter silviterrae]|uniref:GntR family transcriptional regulator n=1 Tax=Dinghuibacter silviterrae TaxID=1539049 RepID=A0A4R8DFH3_9BACT|nr:PLP-dependent aminotransferase family protein [Dinghuibacter silviterrae]TDW96353.1 GntR family transcriptional regulator [Dinghuibacter silviterrae]